MEPGKRLKRAAERDGQAGSLDSEIDTSDDFVVALTGWQRRIQLAHKMRLDFW
jgi:hypothetical protein